MKQWLVALLLLVVAGSARPGRAQVLIALASPTQAGVRGGIVSFTGTITNQSAGTLFLNGGNVNLAGPGLTIDDAPLEDLPLSLAGGARYAGDLFRVQIALTAPFFTYNGSLDLLGGTSAAAFDVIGSAPLQVAVIPEGSVAALVLTALPLLIQAHRRRCGPKFWLP